MTTGTILVERALGAIGVHSVASPAAPEAINLGFDRLKSMLELWLSDGITFGYTPPEVPGDDINEPPDVTSAITDNLAIDVAPYFDNGKNIVSPQLAQNARRNFGKVRNLYHSLTIPDKVVSSTLIRGAGNQRRGFIQGRTFFGRGETLGGRGRR